MPGLFWSSHRPKDYAVHTYVLLPLVGLRTELFDLVVHSFQHLGGDNTRPKVSHGELRPRLRSVLLTLFIGPSEHRARGPDRASTRHRPHSGTRPK